MVLAEGYPQWTRSFFVHWDDCLLFGRHWSPLRHSSVSWCQIFYRFDNKISRLQWRQYCRQWFLICHWIFWFQKNGTVKPILWARVFISYQRNLPFWFYLTRLQVTLLNMITNLFQCLKIQETGRTLVDSNGGSLFGRNKIIAIKCLGSTFRTNRK